MNEIHWQLNKIYGMNRTQVLLDIHVMNGIQQLN